LPIFRSVKLQITACGMVSCCSGGLAVRRAAAWHYVLGVKEDACQARRLLTATVRNIVTRVVSWYSLLYIRKWNFLTVFIFKFYVQNAALLAFKLICFPFCKLLGFNNKGFWYTGLLIYRGADIQGC
jgi:hypothetical protein